MPLTSGVFSRIWKFVDHKAAGQEVTRSDLDTALDDFVPAVNAALEMVASTTQNAAAAAASATAAASSATAAQVVEDRINLGELDAAVAATAADRVQTGLDRAATTSDSAATAADRVQTGLDRTSATSSASTATTQAGIATTQAGTATTQAGIATTQATAASSSAAAASASQTAAAASEAAATTQAGIATTQAASATASATTATTQASAASASAAAAAASQSAAATARTGAETAQTGAQAARSGAEGAQTGAQAAQVGAEAARDVAQAQASLSAGYAASAASVVQQDLSGVTAQALHRSPNAITAMFIYDTSKDSDGGAWTEKCQHTSWWNEAINGKWLGAEISEQYARYVGATVGAELIGDPDLNNPSYWVVGIYTPNLFTISGGQAIRQNNANAAEIPAPVSLTAGKTYRVRVTLTRNRPTIAAATPTNYGTINVQAGVAGQPSNVVSAAKTGNPGDVLDFFITPTTNTNLLGVRSVTNTYTDIEAVSCREVTAITTQTGDYFQLTTDGKFYSLNAGSGTTEVFRGNKRDFPRLAGIVAEAGNVTIYDLTEPGRPMWMRFGSGGPTGSSVFQWWTNGVTLTTCAAQNAVIAVGGSGVSQGLLLFSFAKDTTDLAYATAYILTKPSIGDRNQFGHSYRFGPGYPLPNSTINAVAMTVLPDAPVDPATSLRVPTIAVATGAGVSVIKHDGTVESRGSYAAASQSTVSFDGYNVVIGGIGLDAYWGAWVWNFRDGSTQPYGTHAVVKLNNNNSQQMVRKAGEEYASPQGAGVNLLRSNKTTPAKALLTRISPTFNTGWMTGDIRRCFLSDTVAGSVTGPELVTNGGFDTDTAWTKSTGATISGGQLTVTTASAADEAASQVISVVAGKTYVITVDKASNASADAFAAVITTTDGINLTFGTLPAGVITLVFTAASTGLRSISIGNFSNTAQSVVFNSISVCEAVADRSYKAKGAAITGTLTKAELASGASLMAYSGWSASNYLREAYSSDLDFGTGEWTASALVNIPTANAAAGTIFDRAAASGPRITLSITAGNLLTATASDGTTTRTVTTTAAYNTAQWLKARVNYTTDGTLAILVNGREVAATRGAPLLTLNNASAVLTIGNSYDLSAPFPGSIALLKMGATVPTAEQAIFMFEQEKQMFRAGALSVLPDASALVDMAYDDATDRWVAMSATNESYWTGLVRNSVQAVPAGSFSRVVAGSGVELAARTTTNPGVDVTIPAYGLREELVRRAEAAARLSRELAVYDFVGGFTANTTNGSTAIASVASLTYPTSYIGARISGAGIPANTTITAVSGTTIYLSAAATATATGVSISFLDFALPVGLEAKAVLSAGALRQEGSTKDFTRLFDGFRESIRFAVAPGATAWVQIQAARAAL